MVGEDGRDGVGRPVAIAVLHRFAQIEVLHREMIVADPILSETDGKSAFFIAARRPSLLDTFPDGLDRVLYEHDRVIACAA